MPQFDDLHSNKVINSAKSLNFYAHDHYLQKKFKLAKRFVI